MKRYVHALFLLPVMIFAVACGTQQPADEACSDLPEGKIRQDCIDKMAPKAGLRSKTTSGDRRRAGYKTFGS